MCGGDYVLTSVEIYLMLMIQRVREPVLGASMLVLFCGTNELFHPFQDNSKAGPSLKNQGRARQHLCPSN